MALRSRQAGLEVHAVTRNPATAADLRTIGVSAVEGRLEEGGWHREVPRAPEYMVNCVSSADRTDEGYRRSYVDGMRSILSWAQGGAPAVGVYTSSTGVYGSVTGEVDEQTRPEPETNRSRILREAEILLEGTSAVKRWFILRLSGIYGPGRHQLLDRILAGDSTAGDEPDRPMNILHRDDAVDAVLACLAAPAGVPSQVFNVSGDRPAGRREMMAWLEKETRSFRAGQGAGGRSPAIARTRRRVPERTVSNRRLCETLGWRPRYPDFQSGYTAILRDLAGDSQNP